MDEMMDSCIVVAPDESLIFVFVYSAQGYILLWTVQLGLLRLWIHASCSEGFKMFCSSRLLVLPLLGILLAPEADRNQDLGQLWAVANAA